MKDEPTITVPLAAVPGAITDSIRAVLTAHGYDVCHVAYRPTLIGAKALESLLVELGRNAAQALYCVAVPRDEE